MGAMEKYWKKMPKKRAKAKSVAQVKKKENPLVMRKAACARI